MKQGTKYITLTQRRQIEAGLSMGMSKTDIAKRIGMSLRTVYRELERGKCTQKVYSYTDYWGERHYKTVTAYSADIAEDKFRLNMTSKGAPLKVGNDYDFISYVESRVLDGITPCALVGEMKRNKPCKTVVSKTTMYRYIRMGLFWNISMRHCERKPPKEKATVKRAPKGTSIEQRPKEIAMRNTFGHWEMDCVCSKQGTTSAYLVLSERLTRKEIIFKVPNKKTETIVYCLNRLERRYGKMFRKVFKTITVDNGSEFSDFEGMEKSIYGGKRTSVYYCHPYTSCERGTNERINRDIRKKYPKGTDLTSVTESEVRALEDWVNAYPRAIFGYATSGEKFAEQLRLIS